MGKILVFSCATLAMACGSTKAVGSGALTLTIDNVDQWCTIAVSSPGTTTVTDTAVTDALPGFNTGAVVTLVVTPNAGFKWDGRWTGTDNDSDAAATNTVTMSASKTVTVCCPFTNGTGC